MKILISVHTYYPQKDGVQQVTEYIAEGLALKHDVLVLTNTIENGVLLEEHNKVSIERLETKRNLFHIFEGDKKKYLDRIKSYKPDVLIAVCTQSWPFDWIKRDLDSIDCKKILYTHGYSELEKQYHFWKLLVSGKFGKAFNTILNQYYYHNAYKYIAKFDLVTYLSEGDKAVWYAKKHNLTNGKILGNAVENRFFEIDQNMKKPSIDDGVIRYLFVANYSDKKGQEMVLRAYYETESKNSKLIFCGQKENDYLYFLRELKKKLDNEKGEKEVVFLFEKSREDILELYKTSDIYVCGSLIEAFSISLCEAASCGLAAISTDVGNASTIPGIEIVNSIEEMANKMQFFYDNPEVMRERGEILKEYAFKNCKISDKVAWLEKEISLILNN